MFINVDGFDINYKITGEGEKTLVILQGWGTDMTLYDTVAATVADGYRVVQFDFPGFGKTSEPEESWGVEQYADLFCHLMEKLEIRKTSLLGHSYGGRVIIWLASRDSLPFEIEKIVLLDSAGIMPKRTRKQQLKTRKYKFIKKIVSLRLVYALCPNLIEEWRSQQGSADYKAASPIMRVTLVKAVNQDLTELLPKIRQDTLLIWGDQDTATPLSDGELMDQMIPESGLAVIRGAGHYCFLEQPDVFRRIMEAYFETGENRES